MHMYMCIQFTYICTYITYIIYIHTFILAYIYTYMYMLTSQISSIIWMWSVKRVYNQMYWYFWDVTSSASSGDIREIYPEVRNYDFSMVVCLSNIFSLVMNYILVGLLLVFYYFFLFILSLLCFLLLPSYY